MERLEYRLMQRGREVIHITGKHARAEIHHYAAIYALGGPVIIQRKYGRKWKEAGDAG